MERRRENRSHVNDYVRVTLLSDPPGNPIIGRMLDLSGRGMSLVLAQSVPPGVPVRIDQPDRMLLGEVVYCQPDNGAFRIGVAIEQALRQTSDLLALRRAVNGEPQANDAEVGRNADVTMEVIPAWTQNHST